jgi:hypothetical protein
VRSDELLVTGFAATRLRMELDRIPLWRGEHVAIKQLIEDFGRYLYMPRLKESAVLLEAIREGLRLLTWSQDSFAYAESFDDAASRYRGLRCLAALILSGPIIAFVTVVTVEIMTDLLGKNGRQRGLAHRRRCYRVGSVAQVWGQPRTS